RPSIVVGRSDNGEIDKIDGPYYLFPYLKRLASLPQLVRLPIPVPVPGTVNLVPVDFVAAAIDHIAHKDGLDGKVFHITDPDPPSVGEALDAFSRAAGGPRFARAPGPPMAPFRSPISVALGQMGLPGSIAIYLGSTTTFDTTNTSAALAGSGIAVPRLP